MTDSMRDTLEATFKAIEEREETSEVDTTIPEEEPAAEIEEEEEEESDPKSEPEKPSEKVEAKKPDGKTPDKPTETPAVPEQKDTTLANPPITWKAKAKSLWSTLPDDVKREVRKREQDALNGINQYKEAASYGERLSKTILPYEAMLKARNITPEGAVEEALDLAYRLSTGTPQEKGRIIRHLAQVYQADMTAPNPEQDKTLQVLQPLISKIQQLEQSLQHSKQTEQQRQTQTLEQQVSSFAAETDETGALKRPYFEEVKGLMAALLESGQAKQLDDAYALAVKAHPEVSQIVASAQTEVEKKKAEALQRQQKAQKNGQVNFRPRPAAPVKPAAQGTMRESIESAYNRLMQNA